MKKKYDSYHTRTRIRTCSTTTTATLQRNGFHKFRTTTSKLDIFAVYKWRSISEPAFFFALPFSSLPFLMACRFCFSHRLAMNPVKTLSTPLLTMLHIGNCHLLVMRVNITLLQWLLTSSKFDIYA